jgi:hypothetical protein
MPNILSYPLIPTVSGEDLLIISDISVKGNPTRSVRVNQLVGDGSGSVLSVDATIDGNAITVTGGPITYSGILDFQFGGYNTQYVNGVGDLVSLTSIPTNVTLTTTGTSGAATLTGNALNIPNYAGGTVTSVATSSGTFVDVSGGTITTTGTITADLSAAGTASASTYLRGDNTWASLPEVVIPMRYLAIVTQAGTGAPTASVMVNTTGATITYSYVSAGVYHVTATPGIFFQNTTCFWITPSINNKPWTGAVSIISTTVVELQSIEASTGVAFDDAMDQVTFEIEIFPAP